MAFDIINQWALGYDGLSYEDLVKFENQLRFSLGSVQRARSKLDAQKDVTQPDGKTIETERNIQQSLQHTFQEITASGSLANWLESRTQNRRVHLQSPFVRTFFKNVQSGRHNLKPMTGGQYKRNAIDKMLWLVFELVSLEHACLVVCSFTTTRLI
jgi:hypothetical protein